MLSFSRDPAVAENQMNAIIYYLTGFGYIDGAFDDSEKSFVRRYISDLVGARAEAAMPNASAAVRAEVVTRFSKHFHEVFEQIDHEIKAHFDEAVADGEQVDKFVHAKIKLRCYEIFHSFDTDNQRALLGTVDELIHADGQAHPAETVFRAELEALLGAEIPLSTADLEEVHASQVAIKTPEARAARVENHPFFGSNEHHYSADPARIRKQAEADLALMDRFVGQLRAQRTAGAGRLGQAKTVGDLGATPAFLDGHIWWHPMEAGKRYELTVLGDLHGCYSCLKGSLLQADFFAKLEAWKRDPSRPEPKLILLGDYIDRGMFSYNGVLRTVMQLFLQAPEHVYCIRGNHEYYIEYGGRIYGGVKPAEAINTLVGHMPGEVFEAYMRMFEELPNLLFFGPNLFVHAGIPRESEIALKVHDLASLNDPDIRFQMLWSDPSTADFIPAELQEQNARFPFGKLQFEAFMKRLGCTMMVRGHEKVDEGFRAVYPDSPIALLNLFSAGGTDNDDLPRGSSYRGVTPMALTIAIDTDGTSQVTPWPIDYASFNDPLRNRFFATRPEIEHKEH